MAEREFRKLVLAISQQLVVAETNQIVYLYHLPLEYCGKQPLTVLQLMHNQDIFSATKPDGLANVMKDVNRMDLLKRVKDYSRSSTKQRKISKSRPNDKGSVLDESDPSFHTSLQAKLEVAHIQSSITADSLARAQDMVKGTQLKRVEEIMAEAKTCSDKLSRLLNRAQTLYRLAIAGPGSSDEETPVQKPNITSEQRALPREPSPSHDNDIYSSVDGPGMNERKDCSDSDSDLYTPMDSIGLPQGVQQTQLVTGQTEKRPKPPTHPKPVKQKIEEGVGAKFGESSPRGVPTLPHPAITEMRSTLKRNSSLKRTAAAGGDVTGTRDEGTADYTGGSTGDYTDDSGFAEVKPFMKVPVPVPKPRRNRRSEVPPTGESLYYKTLGAPDPVDCYMTVQRNLSDELLQGSSVGCQEEGAYMNVQRRQLQS